MNKTADTGNKKPSRKTGKGTVGKWLLYFVLFVAIFVFAVKHFSGIEKDFLLLEKVEPWWLAVAVWAQLATYVVTAFIYLILLKAFPTHQVPPLPDLIRAAVVALFFNQTVPSAGVSGNVFFFRSLSRYHVESSNILLLILSELLIFYAAFEALLVVLLAYATIYQAPRVFTSTLLLGIVVYFIFSVVLLLVSSKKWLPQLYQKVTKLRFVRRMLEKSSTTLAGQQLPESEIPVPTFLKAHKATVVRVCLLQLLLFTMDSLTVYALFHGIGIHVPFLVVLLCLACTQIVSLLPFLPGSLVLYESSMSLFFAALHVPLGSAIVATLLFRFLSFWLPMPFGLFFYRKWQKRDHV